MEIESLFTLRGIDPSNGIPNYFRTTDKDFPTPSLPQDKLQNPFAIKKVVIGIGVIVWKNLGFKSGNGAIGSLQAQNEGHSAPSIRYSSLKRPGKQHSGTKTGIQWRDQDRLLQEFGVRNFHNSLSM
jgi:hypothetical protein